MRFPTATAAPGTQARDAEDSLHVLKGAIDLWVGNRCTRLVAGMCARIPRGVAHGFDSVGPDTMVVFKPARA